MSLFNHFRKQRLRLGLLAVLLVALAGGLFTQARAQELPFKCRDVSNIVVCGEEIIDIGPDEFVINGAREYITLGERGGLMFARIYAAAFEHRPSADNLYGATDVIVGLSKSESGSLVHFDIDQEYTLLRLKTVGGLAGILHVNVNTGRVFIPADNTVPLFNEAGIQANALIEHSFVQIPTVNQLFHMDVDDANFAAEFDLLNYVFNIVAPVNYIPLPGGGRVNGPLTIRFAVEEDYFVTGTVDSFTTDIAGLKGVFSRMNIATNGFDVGSVDFKRSDNPGLPNLDATKPDLVFSLQGVQYNDGRFKIRGGAAALPDWQVGSAFKLTKQQVSFLEDDKKKSLTLAISSTLTFPSGSAATDTRTFPMAIRVVGKEQPTGSSTATITGTLMTAARPALNFGPLSISTPAKTELIFDPAKNFFGLQADQVSLRWGSELGSGSGLQTGFKLGVDKDKKLVFGLGAGGKINLPDIRSKALTMQLSGSLASAGDVTTFTLTGIAKLAISGNSGVAPGVTMIMRGGKNVRDVCVGKGVPPGCLKSFEYKLSSFELKIAGFGLGITNAQGTDDGGFTVEKATLKVPVGIKSIGGSISGLKITGEGDVAITGGSVELPPLQVGSFSLVGVKGTFAKTTTGYEFRGAGTIPLPGLDPSGGPGGKKISGEVIIRTKFDGSFQGFGVTIEFNTGSPGIPIGNTGMELVSMRGAFDINAGTIKIGVGMRASTVLKFASFPAATVDGNAELQLSPFKLTANAKLSVLVFNVAQASMGIGHQQGFAGAPGFNVSFSVDLLYVQGSTSLRVGEVTLSNGKKQTVVAASALYRVGIQKNAIVKFVPPVNVNFASVQFDGGHFQVKGGSETLGLMGRVKVNMPLFVPDIKLSVFVDMRGPDVDVTDTDKYTLIDAGIVRARASQGMAGYSTRTLGSAEAQALNLAGISAATTVQQESIPVVIDRAGMALFGISYPRGTPALRLRLPDGAVLTEQTIDQVNSGFLRHTGTLTEEHQLAFILNNAQPGTYAMIVDNAPAVYDKVSYMFNSEPVVSNVLASCGGAPVAGIDVDCGGAPRGPLASINWAAQDTDSPTATVRISYLPVPADGGAPDLSALTTLAEGLPLGDGTFTWDLREVPTGRYQLVVSAEDQRHPAAHVIAPTVISVTDKRAPAAPKNLVAEPLPGELLMTWAPNAERDLAGYQIGFGIVQAGVADSPGSFIYSRDMGAKQVVITASNVLDARLWGLADDQVVFVGIRAYDQSGNYSDWSPLLRAKPWALAPEAWTPAPGGTLPRNGQVEVAFGSPLNLDIDAAIPAGLIELRRADGSLVAGSVEAISNFAGDKVVGLRFVPTAPLRDRATYSVVVKGGAAGVASQDGRQMARDYSWSFVARGQNIFMPLVLR